MKILVTYKSKTGFTKKYAEWISNELNAELKDVKNIKNIDINDYDLVIHGGWIMGGMINGLNKINSLNPKKLIVFAVGFTPKEKVNINDIINVNKLENTPIFYYEGGMNPSKMGFVGRLIVKLVTKEKPTFKDNTDKKEIKEIIKLVKEITK